MHLKLNEAEFPTTNIINYLFRCNLEEKLKKYEAEAGSIEDEVRNYCLNLIASGKYDESRNELEFLYDYYGRRKIKFEALGPIIERVKKNIGWNNNSNQNLNKNMLKEDEFPEDFMPKKTQAKKPYMKKTPVEKKVEICTINKIKYVKSLDDFFEKNLELKEVRKELETGISNVKPEVLQERYKLIQVSLETTNVLEYIRTMDGGNNLSNPVVVIKNLLHIETFTLEKILDRLHRATIPIKLFPPGILYQSGQTLEKQIEKYQNSRSL